ncbi:MAG: Rne/Rng family ribonuclease [Clostridia bacterium]|nr:Rne/Rng family ribonuclease [Clostridia bacterium]
MKRVTKKEWFLDRYCNQQFAALVEEGELKEFHMEDEPRTDIVGNIYKGKVVNVLAGMNAAFVNCGFHRNCYLSLEESYTDPNKYDGTPVAHADSPLNVKIGDEIIVQVTKPERGSKGAKVSARLSFVGNRIIYMPNTGFLGVSRRITDENIRAELLQTAQELQEHENEGFVMRTKAPHTTKEGLIKEATYLKKLYTRMIEFAKEQPIGTVLYEDEDLPFRVMRESIGEEINAFRVGDAELYQRLSDLIELGDFPKHKLQFYDGERTLMNEYGISPLLYAAASPIVPLKNGGSLVIEHTEAMTVVDVNTGKYVGSTTLEETAFTTNLEAAHEIARQVRLRNIGGIIVVDFIDMLQESHRQDVTETLRACLSGDKAKCNVLPMSELCITEFTRRRLGNDARSHLVKPCPVCKGNGYVHDDIFVLTQIRSSIIDCFIEGHLTAVVDLHERIMYKILQDGLYHIEKDTRWKGHNVYFVPHKTYKEHQYTVHGEDTLTPTLPPNATLLS